MQIMLLKTPNSEQKQGVIIDEKKNLNWWNWHQLPRAREIDTLVAEDNGGTVGRPVRATRYLNQSNIFNKSNLHSVPLSKIRKISCPVESLDEDVRYMVYKW